MNRAGAGVLWLAFSMVGCSSSEPPSQPGQAGSGGSAGVAGGAVGGAGASGAGAANAGSVSGGAAGASGASGGAGSGGASGMAGGGGSGGMVNPLNVLAQAFEAFRMDLPCDHDQEQACEPQNSAMPNLGYLCCYIDSTTERKNRPPVDKDLAFGGDAGKLYDVTLRVRGVVENRDYGGGGTKQGDWVRVGGERPAPSAIHVFGITTHDPEQTYFLNSWNDLNDKTRMVAIDYEVTIQMRGGSQARVFEYDDIGKIWKNAGALKVEGIPPFPDAPEGQFMQFNVVSVAPAP